MSKGHILVDLDGTLAEYEHYMGPTVIGAPVALMVQRVKYWLNAGVDVRIFTARVSTMDQDEYRTVVNAIEAWCLEHLGAVLPITCAKDYETLAIYDDRAVQVEFNTGRLVEADPR